MNTSTQQTILPKPYLHWLIFVQTLITIAFQIISITLLSRIVFYRFMMRYKYETRAMSTLVTFYMIVHIIGSSMSLPYELYLAVLWKPAMPIIPIDSPLYNPYVLYWAGAFMGTYIVTAAVPVFFLTLDRCVALKFPIHYYNNIKYTRGKMLTLAITVTLLWCVVSGIFGTMVELPLDISKVRYCQVMACLNIKYYGLHLQYIKIFVALINVFCTAYFFYVLRGTKLLNGDPKVFIMNNRIVIVTTLSEMLFNVAPIGFSILFTKITGESQANVFGNIIMLPFTLDVFICSIFYTKTFLSKSLQRTKTSSDAQMFKTRVIAG